MTRDANLPQRQDPLAREVSVSAKIDETGLSARAKSRAIAAFDRLVGSVIDIPTAHLERRATLTRAITDKQKELIDAAELPLVSERALKNYLRDIDREQTNRDAVALCAMENLKEGPSPENGSDTPLDDDWLNIFSSHARNASTMHLRDLWGRLLAGEIRRPGSFSLSTLRVISELDREIAETFQRYMAHRLESGMLPKPNVLEGQTLLDLTFLEEVGLLQDVNGFLGIDLRPNESGFVIQRHEHAAIRLKPKNGAPLRLSLIRVTRVGREIASILPREPELSVLRYVADLLKPDCDSIEIGSVVSLPDGTQFADFNPI